MQRDILGGGVALLVLGTLLLGLDLWTVYRCHTSRIPIMCPSPISNPIAIMGFVALGAGLVFTVLSLQQPPRFGQACSD